MDDLWKLIADQLSDRVGGPLKSRIFLQPLMATFLAIRSGLADAESGKDPYFWSFLFARGRRFEIAKDGWKSVGRLFLLAYVIVRGPVTRVATALTTRPPAVADSASAEKTPRGPGADEKRT